MAYGQVLNMSHKLPRVLKPQRLNTKSRSASCPQVPASVKPLSESEVKCTCILAARVGKFWGYAQN